MTGAPLLLHNSLTRTTEAFAPIDPANVRVYSCGPTVYNYAHIGNLRAYVFTDTLARVLRWKGYPLTHIINITDVGHLTVGRRCRRRQDGSGRQRQRAGASGTSPRIIPRRSGRTSRSQHPRADALVRSRPIISPR